MSRCVGLPENSDGDDMKTKKSFREKLADDHGLPRVEPIIPTIAKRWRVMGTMVIPAPREVDEIMRRVRSGRLVTINQIGDALAERHGTTVACRITTGIFASIAAHAAAEDEAEGRKRITPYWRTLKRDGEINAKYPGGLAGQKKRLEAEGHAVITRGKRAFVADYERRLMKD